MKKILIVTAALTLLASCRKEIEMDYIPVEKLYVIDGYVSDRDIRVTVSRTRDMEDGNRNTSVSDAVVKISGGGLDEVLRYDPVDDSYRSWENATGSPGNTYTLTVKTSDGKEFVSKSKMGEPGKIVLPIVFSYEPVITTRYMLFSVGITDPPGADTRYCLRIYRNGDIFSRTLITDKGHNGSVIPNTLLVRFSWDADPTPEEEEERPDIFRKGDKLDMALETIDRPVYDYLYSLGLSGGSLSNPLTNIEGGCLGYFSAFSSDTFNMIFDPEAMVGPRP